MSDMEHLLFTDHKIDLHMLQPGLKVSDIWFVTADISSCVHRIEVASLQRCGKHFLQGGRD